MTHWQAAGGHAPSNSAPLLSAFCSRRGTLPDAAAGPVRALVIKLRQDSSKGSMGDDGYVSRVRRQLRSAGRVEMAQQLRGGD